MSIQKEVCSSLKPAGEFHLINVSGAAWLSEMSCMQQLCSRQDSSEEPELGWGARTREQVKSQSHKRLSLPKQKPGWKGTFCQGDSVERQLSFPRQIAVTVEGLGRELMPPSLLLYSLFILHSWSLYSDSCLPRSPDLSFSRVASTVYPWHWDLLLWEPSDFLITTNFNCDNYMPPTFSATIF